MKIREILKTDLGAFFRRKVDEPPMGDALVEDDGEIDLNAATQGSIAFEPLAWKHRQLSANWKGPRFQIPSVRRESLLTTLEQLAILSDTNLSFIHGLNVAARETQRLQLASSGGRAYRTIFLLLCVFMLALSIVLISMDFPVAGSSTTLMLFIFVVPHMPPVARRRQLDIYLSMRDRLNRGLSLSETMHSLPRLFPRYCSELVAAAEKSGKLSAALRRLIDDQRHVRGITEGNYAILAYLGMILITHFLVVLFMLVKVIPVFTEIVAEFESTTNAPLTNIMFGAINFLLFHKENIALALLCCAIVITLCVLAARHDRGERGEGIYHDIMSLIARPAAWCATWCPGLRAYVAKVNLAKAAYILENLLRVGVPLPEAMRTAAYADLNPLYRDLILRMEARISEGDSFFEALQRSRRFLPVPGSFAAFAQLAESSGTLPEAMGRLGMIYRTETQNYTRILAETFAPVCVVLMGGITLVFVGGCFSLITDLTYAVLDSM